MKVAIIIAILLLLPANALIADWTKDASADFDPLVDIKVAIKIKRARSMEGEKNYEIKIFIDGMKNETRL
ncbi:MAG: hypothetical protein DRN29_00395, partial [Thermoplasmata archaeon]